MDSTRPVRWGILGAGFIAGLVASAVVASADSELSAIGSRSLDRAAALADQVAAPEARLYGSYDDLVADPDVDIVYIATPHAQHHEHALLALRAGKPVLVEKAFTLTAREAREVLDEARARDLFCMEAMWMRVNPLVLLGQKLVADGVFGELLSVTADHGQSFPFDPTNRLFAMELGGGALLDLGVYSAAVAWTFLGRPDGVVAVGKLSPTGSDLDTAMQWSYDDGRFAHVSSTTRSATPTTATVVGTTGWMRFEDPFYNPPRLVIHTERDGDQVIERGDNPYPYGAQVTEVERCLRAGRLESQHLPWSYTLGMMELMDDARAQVGVRYAADDEDTAIEV